MLATMRRPFNFVMVLALYLACGNHPSAAGEPVSILTYRFDRDGVPFTVNATNFNGICNVTVQQRTAGGMAEKSAPMEEGTFSKLMDGVARTPAITSTKLPDGSPKVDTKTHHLITTFKKSDTDFMTEMYGAADKDAPESFRAWLKLLQDSIPKL